MVRCGVLQCGTALDEGARRVIDGSGALKLGGRFVAEFGAAGNVAVIVAAGGGAHPRGLAIVSPWFSLSPRFTGRCSKRVASPSSGWNPFAPDPAAGRCRRLAGNLRPDASRHRAPAERPALIAELVEALRPRLSDDAGNWQVRLCAPAFRGAPTRLSRPVSSVAGGCSASLRVNTVPPHCGQGGSAPSHGSADRARSRGSPAYRDRISPL